LHLSQLGLKVVLLEAERIGWGASGRNGGHVGVGQRKGQQDLESALGDEVAHTLWDYGLEAVELVRTLCEQHRIECDLKQGILHVAARASHVDDLKHEVSHLHSAYGYQDIRYVDRDETAEMLGSDGFYGGQLDSGSLHLHPLNFVLGMATAAEVAGAKIFENSLVTSFAAGSPNVVNTGLGSVRAKHLVIGCNGYLEGLNGSMAAKIMPINNFILATEPLSESLAKSLIRDDVAVQDSLFVINYWKLSGDNRLLFGGGENYTRRFPSDIKAFVSKYMLRVYPQLGETRIDYGWGGTLAVTMNRLPSFGRLAENVLFAQGFSGHGVPTATMAGKLLAEAISGDAARFDVMADLPISRFPGGVLLRWPGLVAGMLYHSLKDRF
jgi:gamma-glutamylputrescine oxidase